MNDETLGMNNFISDVDIISALEEFGIFCKDSNGNWRNTEEILQDIAEHWKNTKDLVEEYFNNKEE